jgi:hypothetical protein
VKVEHTGLHILNESIAPSFPSAAGYIGLPTSEEAIGDERNARGKAGRKEKEGEKKVEAIKLPIFSTRKLWQFWTGRSWL